MRTENCKHPRFDEDMFFLIPLQTSVGSYFCACAECLSYDADHSQCS